MTHRLDNPDLDRLVQELNVPGGTGRSEGSPGDEESGAGEASSQGRSAGGRLPWPEEPTLPAMGTDIGRVDEGDPLRRLLGALVQQGASDLLLVSGLAPTARIDGDLVPIEGFETPDPEALSALFRPHLSERAQGELDRVGSADFTLRLVTGSSESRGWRFRVNLHRQRGQPAAAIRVLPRTIPTLKELNLPPDLGELVRSSRGLVLVCGPTGSGKSSTLAALVGVLNRSFRRHLILIEDPVEYDHRSDRSLVEQIEVGRDTRSFADALRSSLRQDPDVILVGEMRDLETVRSALTAAETGHLVLSTLHTHDSAQAIHRIVDVFPPGDREQIRHQLSLSLHAIVSQQLVPRSDRKGRLPAIELLRATHAVRHLIRNDQLQKLHNEITLSKRHGMISLEESLAGLVRQGAIELEEARARSARPDELDSLLRAL